MLAQQRQVIVSTHSRPKAAAIDFNSLAVQFEFQHTAARRRLYLSNAVLYSTRGFNTQPPEGGWLLLLSGIGEQRFQHTAARRRLRSGFIF